MVGVTADVLGNYGKAHRIDAGQEQNKIVLEPQGKVLWLEEVELGS